MKVKGLTGAQAAGRKFLGECLNEAIGVLPGQTFTLKHGAEIISGLKGHRPHVLARRTEFIRKSHVETAEINLRLGNFSQRCLC